jgi:hypothetical protein
MRRSTLSLLAALTVAACSDRLPQGNPVNTLPTVTITAPANNSSFTAGTNVTFTGTASDVQDGNLTASIAWTSNPDGALGTGGTLSSSTLSVGTHTITASVTDTHGASGSAAISITINAPNTPPTVTITVPANNSSFTAGTNVTFTGTASDTQDGDLTSSLAWASSIDGALGTGGSVSSSTLSVGTHTITASVTDTHGASGSAAISITINAPPPPSGCTTPTPPGFNKTWSGATSIEWSDASNWSPAGVPVSTDNVFICTSASHQPTLAANATINDLLIENGATLTIATGHTLVSTGNVSSGQTAGAGTLSMSGSSKTVAGTVANLSITGTVTTLGALTITANLSITAGALTLGGQQITVGGNLSRTSTGLLVMTNASDLLVVGGTAFFQTANSEGTLTAGELRVAGNFTVDVGDRPFAATGSHRTVLNGSAPQTLKTVNTGPAANRFFDLDITNTAGLEITHNSHVTDDLALLSAITVSGAGVVTVMDQLTTVVGSNMTLAGVRIGGASGTTGVQGSFSPGTTSFFGSSQPIKAGLAYQSVTIEPTGSAQLVGTSAFSGNLSITGGLTLGGHALTVGGNLQRTGANGVLTMTNASDLLVVGGTAFFQTANSEGMLTAGELRVAGNFTVSTGDRPFAATGSHRTVLNGSAPQTLQIVNTGPAANRFFDLDITNTAGVSITTANAHVSHDLNLIGQLTVPSTTTLTIVNTLFLRSTAVLNNSGTINEGSCVKEAGATVNGTDPCS